MQRRGTGRRRLAWIAASAFAAALVPASAAFAAGGTTSGADIQVSGSASTGSPAPGASYSYTFQLKNSGPDTAAGVGFTDPLPPGTVYNYATANGSTLPCAAVGALAGGASVSCRLGDLAKGGQSTVVVNVSAPLNAATYPNTGSASSSSVDPNTTNNQSTVTVQVKAAAGGVNKGGVNDTAPLPATPCAVFGGLSAPVGYYLTWAAIWNTFTIRSCSANIDAVNVEVTETNVLTGAVDYDVIYPISLLSGQNSSMVLDNDFAPFNTTYSIGFTATDATGTVLATGSVMATTPPPQ